MAANLPELPDIQRLSPRVIRILGGNPSKFTLQGTNIYLIGQGPKRILIDTGEGNRIWPPLLQQALKDENATVDQIILTHWHPDHVGGVADVKALCGDDIKVFKNQTKPHINTEQHDIQNNKIFETSGASLRAFHCPGHAVDHMALVLMEEDAMFTGDNVLGHGTAVFEDLPAYMRSLEGMQQQFNGRAYPAHGDVIEDGKGKVAEYIKHRREREEQILGVLRAEGGERGSMEIVKVVYKGYPEGLWGPAEGGVVQVLGKLEGEGRVRRGEGGKWGLGPKSAL